MAYDKVYAVANAFRKIILNAANIATKVVMNFMVNPVKMRTSFAMQLILLA